MKKMIYSLVILCSISYVTKNYAMENELDAPYNYKTSLDEYIPAASRWLGVTALKGIRSLVCGKSYSSATNTCKSETPYDFPTIELWVYNKTTAGINSLLGTQQTPGELSE